uniref:Integrase_H2C2 domain-containing protein n=1 Tax=Strongyloides papillosus TaxID=174720 RepID=A0A0N5BL28_STREA
MHVNPESSDVLLGFPFLKKNKINIFDISKSIRDDSQLGDKKFVKGIEFDMSLPGVEKFLAEVKSAVLTDDVERGNVLVAEVNLVDFRPKLMRETKVPDDIKDEVISVFKEYCDKGFLEKIDDKSNLPQIADIVRDGKFKVLSIGDIDKAFFRVSLIGNILDHLVVATNVGCGIEIPETEIDRLYSLPCPNTKEELKSTLAKYQYRAQCIPQYSKFAASLHKYTGAVQFDKSKVQNLYQKLRESIKENVKLYPIEDEAKYIKVIVEADDFAIWYSSFVVVESVVRRMHSEHKSGSAMVKEAKRYIWFDNLEKLLMNEYKKCNTCMELMTDRRVAVSPWPT